MPVAVATLVLDIDTVAAAIGALISKMAEVAAEAGPHLMPPLRPVARDHARMPLAGYCGRPSTTKLRNFASLSRVGKRSLKAAELRYAWIFSTLSHC